MKPARRYLTFSLRTLFVLVTALAVWLGIVIDRAREQQEAVKAIEALGGVVTYDWQSTSLYGEYGMYVLWSANQKRDCRSRKWLCPITGDDLFHDVDVVGVPATRLAETMPHLDRLPGLSHLLIIFPAGQPPDGWPLD